MHSQVNFNRNQDWLCLLVGIRCFCGSEAELIIQRDHEEPACFHDESLIGTTHIVDNNESIRGPVARGGLAGGHTRSIVLQAVSGIEAAEQERLPLILLAKVLIQKLRLRMSGGRRKCSSQKDRGDNVQRRKDASHGRIL